MTGQFDRQRLNFNFSKTQFGCGDGEHRIRGLQFDVRRLQCDVQLPGFLCCAGDVVGRLRCPVRDAVIGVYSG